MKTSLLLIPFVALLAIGCASTKGNQESYFGYSNSPKIESKESAPRIKEHKDTPVADKSVTNQDADQDNDNVDADSSQDQDWVNPLADDDAADNQDSDDGNYAAVPSGYYPYSAPAYVPVVVPWWDYYSGWMGSYYTRPVIAVRYSNWYWGWGSYCDWYSPYYAYHPCYGVSFGYYRPFYGGGYHTYWRPWHHYPIYSYHSGGSYNGKPNTVRRWGTGTGVVPSTSGGRNSVNSTTNVKSTPSVRNERGQSSQNPASNSSNSVRDRSSSSPSVRNERSRDTPASSQQGNSPRSGTSTLPRNETPVRRERSDVSPTPRSETPARRENTDTKPTPRTETPARKENTDSKPREQAPVRNERPRASMYESSQRGMKTVTPSQSRNFSPVSRGYSSSPSQGSSSSSSPRGGSFSSQSSSSSSSSSSSPRSGRRP